jgi:hypothetical protein
MLFFRYARNKAKGVLLQYLLAPTKETNLNMTYKWNSADAETYAKDFSSLICNEFFKTQKTISGSDILKITEIKQLNLLVIRNLFEKWQEESSRLKSPYFDFEQKEVKTALLEFMNILSRFISVQRDKFEILLAQSVKDTLQLCLEPRTFYDNLMRNLPEFKLKNNWIEGNKKYFEINKDPLLSLESKLNGEIVFANQGIDWLEGIFSTYIADDPSEILEDLDGILKLNLNQGSGKTSFFDEAFDIASAPVKKLQPVGKLAPQKEVVPINIMQATVIQKVEKVYLAKKVISDPLSLNDKLINASKTLNDNVVLNKSTSLGDSHGKSKIASLKTSVSLNQRFLFINNLFGGSQEVYQKSIEKLDGCSSLSEAQNMVVNEIALNHNWDNKSAEAEEFYALLERKFN